MTIIGRPRWVPLAAILVLVCTACSASATVTIDESALASSTTARGAVSDPPSTTTTEAGTNDPPSMPAPGCSYLGLDDFDDIQIELIFTSAVEVQDDAFAHYELRDGSGAVFHSASSFVEDAAPGESFRLHVDTVKDVPPRVKQSSITCEFIDLEPFGFGDSPHRRTSADSCSFVGLDSFDDVQIELAVTNPSPQSQALVVDYALRGRNGLRFGQGVEFFGQVGGDTPVGQEVDTFTELPEWVSTADFTCDILAIATTEPIE